jgi:hypothetical protein
LDIYYGLHKIGENPTKKFIVNKGWLNAKFIELEMRLPSSKEGTVEPDMGKQ